MIHSQELHMDFSFNLADILWECLVKSCRFREGTHTGGVEQRGQDEKRRNSGVRSVVLQAAAAVPVSEVL